MRHLRTVFSLILVFLPRSTRHVQEKLHESLLGTTCPGRPAWPKWPKVQGRSALPFRYSHVHGVQQQRVATGHRPVITCKVEPSVASAPSSLKRSALGHLPNPLVYYDTPEYLSQAVLQHKPFPRLR